jgi:hypothetical protein
MLHRANSAIPLMTRSKAFVVSMSWSTVGGFVTLTESIVRVFRMITIMHVLFGFLNWNSWKFPCASLQVV